MHSKLDVLLTVRITTEETAFFCYKVSCNCQKPGKKLYDSPPVDSMGS